MANDVPGNPNNPNNFPVIPGNTLEQTMPVFGDLALFPSIKKIYQKYFPNLDMSSGDYKEFNLERDKLPPEQQQAFMTELLADPMVQGAMSAPKSTVSVGPDAQVSSIGGLAPDEIPPEERTPENNYGCPVGYVRDPVTDACVNVRGEGSGEQPGDRYDPIGAQPGPFEMEDISDANTRQDMIQDMRDGTLNPWTLSDKQLRFFTKRDFDNPEDADAERARLAEFFNTTNNTNYSPPEDEDIDDAMDTQSDIDDIRNGTLDPDTMSDEDLADIGLTRDQAEDIYGELLEPDGSRDNPFTRETVEGAYFPDENWDSIKKDFEDGKDVLVCVDGICYQVNKRTHRMIEGPAMGGTIVTWESVTPDLPDQTEETNQDEMVREKRNHLKD